MVNLIHNEKGLLLFMATLFFLSGLGFYQPHPVSAENPETLMPNSNYPLVSDYANILSPDTVNQIRQANEKMASYDDQVQIAVLTVNSTDGQSIADFTNDLTLRSDWHPGSKKYDNGVLIVFAKNGGKNNVRIATGTGMEQYLPDATLHKLLLENQSKLKSSSTSQNDQGILDLFLDVRGAYAGNPSPNNQTGTQQGKQSTTQKAQNDLPNGLVLFLLVLVVLTIWKVLSSLKKKKGPTNRAYDYENYQDTSGGPRSNPSRGSSGRMNGFSWFSIGWLLSWLFSHDDDDHHDHFDGSGGFGGGSDFGGWGGDAGGGDFGGGDAGGGDFGGGDFGGGGSDF
ncbi:TPM domain-containing protein [Fructobacillus fructosus]|uniref:TPM domain-containing protein n=1 Tax=Fructobacillus fructosus TaxID=1631 RepID=UPI004034F1FB